ncbi:MAG: ABC transporter ATP-binding protein [Planctomycetota bacterium]
MIEFQEVERSYGEKLAVRRLNLRIVPGELFSLLGHNGAGKTTTIKMLVGLLQPGAGRVRVCGHDLATRPREATQTIGYVPDQPYLYDKLSGREFLRFVGEMHGLEPQAVEEAVQREAERFGLGPFMDELTESYSHGMKQRTVFASALLHSPRVLVVDEPMVGLDPQSIRLVKDLLRREANAGMCVLMSTHTLSAAEEISDRIGVMSRGDLIFEGTVEELKSHGEGTSDSLEATYLKLMEDPPTADEANGSAGEWHSQERHTSEEGSESPVATGDIDGDSDGDETPSANAG